MSTFDPNAFANAQFTDANATTFAPIPEGEFVASVDKQAIRTTEKGNVILDVTWKIDDPQVAEETGIASPSVRQSIFLDITPSGGLDFGKGKNVGLGRLREALNQNNAGQPWSFGNLVGAVAKIRVTQRIVRDDATGVENIYNDVRGVTKL
jgi:hypothetical protein